MPVNTFLRKTVIMTGATNRVGSALTFNLLLRGAGVWGIGTNRAKLTRFRHEDLFFKPVLADLAKEKGRVEAMTKIQADKVKIDTLILNASESSLRDLCFFAELVKPQMAMTTRILLITPLLQNQVDETVDRLREIYWDQQRTLALATACVNSDRSPAFFQQYDQAGLELQNWSYAVGRDVLEHPDHGFNRGHFDQSGALSNSSWLDDQEVYPTF